MIPVRDSSHAVRRKPGEVLAGRYRILRELGSGASGTTYEAAVIADGARVALKELPLHGARGWKAVELFHREAVALRGFAHPRLPRLIEALDLGDEDAQSYVLVRSLVPGDSLEARVRGGWRATEADARELARQLLDAVQYLHGRVPPVVHRDIKPSNVICGPDGGATIVDFGTVGRFDAEGGGSTIVGTPGYMAPELLRGLTLCASDLYALGGTVVFALTGTSPDRMPQRRLVLDFQGRVRVSRAFARWLEQMMAPALEDRFHSAAEAIEALCDRAPSRAIRTPRDRRRRPLHVLAAAVVCISGATAALIGHRSPPPREAPRAVATVSAVVTVEPAPVPVQTQCASRHCAVEFPAGGSLVAPLRGYALARGFTLEAWVKGWMPGGHNIRVFELDAQARRPERPAPAVWLSAGDVVFLPMRKSIPYAVVAQRALESDTWHHVAVTLESNWANVYVDGRLVLQRAIGPGELGAPADIAIGGGQQPITIDEARFWDHPRSVEEIQATMRTRLRGDEPGLVIYFPFDEGDDVIATDESPRHVHATLAAGYGGRPCAWVEGAPIE
jgi:hypothetical protein